MRPKNNLPGFSQEFFLSLEAHDFSHGRMSLLFIYESIKIEQKRKIYVLRDVFPDKSMIIF